MPDWSFCWNMHNHVMHRSWDFLDLTVMLNKILQLWNLSKTSTSQGHRGSMRQKRGEIGQNGCEASKIQFL